MPEDGGKSSCDVRDGARAAGPTRRSYTGTLLSFRKTSICLHFQPFFFPFRRPPDLSGPLPDQCWSYSTASQVALSAGEALIPFSPCIVYFCSLQLIRCTDNCTFNVDKTGLGRARVMVEIKSALIGATAFRYSYALKEEICAARYVLISNEKCWKASRSLRTRIEISSINKFEHVHVVVGEQLRILEKISFKRLSLDTLDRLLSYFLASFTSFNRYLLHFIKALFLDDCGDFVGIQSLVKSTLSSKRSALSGFIFFFSDTLFFPLCWLPVSRLFSSRALEKHGRWACGIINGTVGRTVNWPGFYYTRDSARRKNELSPEEEDPMMDRLRGGRVSSG